MKYEEKLVRDRVPEIIEKGGRTPKYRRATETELDQLFREKIAEESRELLESGDIEEVVDILEAIDAFLRFRKMDLAFLEMQKHAKRLARGGFDEGFVLLLDDNEPL